MSSLGLGLQSILDRNLLALGCLSVLTLTLSVLYYKKRARPYYEDTLPPGPDAGWKHTAP